MGLTPFFPLLEATNIHKCSNMFRHTGTQLKCSFIHLVFSACTKREDTVLLPAVVQAKLATVPFLGKVGWAAISFFGGLYNYFFV